MMSFNKFIFKVVKNEEFRHLVFLINKKIGDEFVSEDKSFKIIDNSIRYVYFNCDYKTFKHLHDEVNEFLAPLFEYDASRNFVRLKKEIDEVALGL